MCVFLFVLNCAHDLALFLSSTQSLSLSLALYVNGRNARFTASNDESDQEIIITIRMAWHVSVSLSLSKYNPQTPQTGLSDVFRLFLACSRIFNSEAQREFFKSNHVTHRPGCLPLIQNVNSLCVHFVVVGPLLVR